MARFVARLAIGSLAKANETDDQKDPPADEEECHEPVDDDDQMIDAGAVRFRPMMLTAAAVIVGASVILFDPIFQGLAISLMSGEVASLLLSRMTVPVLYYLSERSGDFNVWQRDLASGQDRQLTHYQGHPVRGLSASRHGDLVEEGIGGKGARTRSVFPTPVGMNRSQPSRCQPSARVPHACGDEPTAPWTTSPLGWCSPRLWG